jgi:hypothetical protein
LHYLYRDKKKKGGKGEGKGKEKSGDEIETNELVQQRERGCERKEENKNKQTVSKMPEEKVEETRLTTLLRMM